MKIRVKTKNRDDCDDVQGSEKTKVMIDNIIFSSTAVVAVTLPVFWNSTLQDRWCDRCCCDDVCVYH